MSEIGTQPEKPQVKFINIPATKLQMLDIKQVAALINVSESTIKSMVASGEFPEAISVRKTGSKSARRWTLAQYEAWAQKRAATAA